MHLQLRLCLSFVVVLLSACASTPRPTPRVPSGPAIVIRDESHQGDTLRRAQDVAFRAFALVGTPYVYGGNSLATGFDCSGFTQFVFRDAVGLDLPRTAQQQFDHAAKISSRAALRLGDLVFFAQAGRVFHVGIYVGEGQFVHAPRTGKSIELSRLDSRYWSQLWSGTVRVIR
jgi:cell wall-associated NlpC family hydrolase